MPIADLLTPIRTACDIDLDEEAAWAYAAQFVAIPCLVFAATEYYRAKNIENHVDWYTLKARTANEA